jgi:peptidoglycan hydrolase-like protein with peptidoglycan-binding domain
MTKHNKVTLGLLIVVIAASGLLTLTAYASDTNTIRAVQLMLSLKEYDLGYGDSKGIDGKLGQITRGAIKDYQAKKQLTPTGNVDKWLYDSLYEDIKSKPTTPPPVAKVPPEPETDDSKKINALSGELNTTKDDLRDAKAILDTLRNDMDNNSIAGFRDQAVLLSTFLAILVAIITFVASYWINKVLQNIKQENDIHRLKIHDDRLKILDDVENAYSGST